MQLSISLPPATFLALILGLLLHPISTGSHHGASQRKLQKRLEDVFRRFSPLVTKHATLNYGHDCISPYEEKLRQEIVEELHLIATSHATLGHVKDAINKMEEFISMNDKELCNYRLALFCDQQLRKCVCGPNRVNVSYVWEENKCHYAEGSMCMANSKIECSSDTRCISMSNLDECSSGLCFCQREYYPARVTTTAPKTTTPVKFLDYDDEDSEEDEEEADIAKVHRDRVELESAISTKETFKEAISESESESDSENDDDDNVEGEHEQVIVVKLDQMQTTAQSLPASKIEQEEDKQDTDENGRMSAVPTPIFTPPIPVPTRRQELTSAIKRLERDVESIKTLAFGDECSSISEESNYAEYRRLVNDMDCVTGENDEENLMEILGKLESILVSGNQMCNWTQHLQCNSQSKKCECRTSSEDLDGFNLLFMEEGKHCVLVENSRCLSKEYLLARKSPFSSIPCARESKCVAEETKAECKSKIENCFCRKTTAKPTEATKQKKSRSRGKTSTATSPFSHFVGRARFSFEAAIVIFMLVYTTVMPGLVFIT